MNHKREALARLYSPTWVASKTDAQVHNIYMRLLDKGVLK